MVILMAHSWRDATKGYTRRMAENATRQIRYAGTVLISPPSAIPEPSAEDLALRAEREEDARQKEIFFNKMHYVLDNFERTFLEINADVLVKNPELAGRQYDLGSFPKGEKGTIETRVRIGGNLAKPAHFTEACQIARIDMARKLINAGASHGADYVKAIHHNSLWMVAVPVCLDRS